MFSIQLYRILHFCGYLTNYASFIISLGRGSLLISRLFDAQLSSKIALNVFAVSLNALHFFIHSLA